MRDVRSRHGAVGEAQRRPPGGAVPALKASYYIQAASPAADVQSRVLKQGDTFAVFDHYGDINPAGLGEEGLYHEGTRYLSAYLLELGHDRPLYLSSTVKDDNDVLAVDLTNPDVVDRGHFDLPRGQLHLCRSKFVWQGVCYEQVQVQSYWTAPARVHLALGFAADFADIFEVRGMHRQHRGEYLEPETSEGLVVLAYRGLDGVVRRTRLSFRPRPTELRSDLAIFEISLPAHGSVHIDIAAACERGSTPAAPQPVSPDHLTAAANDALAAVAAYRLAARRAACTLRSSNHRFNDWVSRAESDLHMMTTDVRPIVTEWDGFGAPAGALNQSPILYPFAGVPWFSTPFGRDGIITALEMLSLQPALARGVLTFLAATQATKVIPERDAQPGKILHEMRGGEMAALGEVPFGCYYGSVDATPLFVYLAGAYYDRTGDRQFIAAIWPNILAALQWIDHYGDSDGDGFVEYARTNPRGLIQQGWKDSHDAIFHSDGSAAKAPIALCEVQGYVYAAKRAAARLADLLGESQRATDLRHQAEQLQDRFLRAFWCDDLSTLAMALDGNKRPCKVRNSNAGQCLFTGIVRRAFARRLAQTLLTPESFSGWGIRTIAVGEALYNPMSYHNGSVWPHDNALIAFGLGHHGLKQAVVEIMTAQFDAVMNMDLHRMPELFCGFPRRPGEGPTLYPVACAPQAWAAAAVFLLVQSCLGLSINGPEKQIYFSYPLMPSFLAELHINNLQIGQATVDLLLRRHGQDVGLNVLRREGDVEIHMVQ